jgi:spermidine synthase
VSAVALRILVLLGAALAGAGSVALEASWYRAARLAFGDDVWSSALVTGACMAGMGAGAAATMRVRGGPRRALCTLVPVELALAVLGFGVAALLPHLAEALAAFDVAHAHQPLLVRWLRFAIAFGLLVIPSGALGMAFPLWTRSTSRGPQGALDVGLVYGAETLGAFAGALGSELWGVPRYGLRGAACAAALLCVLSAGAAAVGARLRPASDAGAPVPEAAELVVAGGAQRLARWLAAWLLGFSMLGLEVAWVRLFGLFLADTPLLFVGVLALVLAGLSGGSLSARMWLAWRGRVGDAAPVLCGAATLISLGLVALPRVLAALFRLDPTPLQVLALQAPLVVPVAWASGAGFVLLVAQPGDERLFGEAVTANALGGALGAALTALLVLPVLGLEHGLFACAALFGAAALAAAFAAPAEARSRWPAWAMILLGLVAFPFGSVERLYVQASLARWRAPGDELVRLAEGPSATLAWLRSTVGGRTVHEYLVTNAYAMASNDFAARRYMRLFVTLPTALQPRVEQAAVIGLGLGTTVQALTDLAEVRRVDVIDNSRETFAIARERARVAHQGFLDDPRLHTHVEDARHHLLGTERRYDLITGEPPPPSMLGVSGLYSREFFALLHDRLRDGGQVSYWLPLLNITPDAACAIVRAFCAAFSDCSLWDGSGANFVLLGSRGRSEPVSLARYTAQWSEPGIARELADVGFEHPVQLAATFVGDAPFLAQRCAHVAPLEDDRPADLRAHVPGDGLSELVNELHDSAANRARFLASGYVKERLPARARESAGLFDQQRLFNDLLAGHAPAFHVGILDQVLTRTPFKLPVLLLLGSDPDVQRAWAAAPGGADGAGARHALAAALADRRTADAQALAQAASAEPLPGLWAYLASSRQQPPTTAGQN